MGLACAGSDDPAPACAFRRPVRAYMRQIATARRRARRWAKGASTRRGTALGEDYLQILPQGHLHAVRSGSSLRQDAAPQCQHVVERNAELLLDVCAQAAFDKSRIEAIEAGRHRGMGCEEIASSRNSQCDFEGLSGRLHKTARTFQDKHRMSFI